jgi:hypothetical protein
MARGECVQTLQSIKIGISTVLTDTSGSENSQNRGLLLLMSSDEIKCCFICSCGTIGVKHNYMLI